MNKAKATITLGSLFDGIGGFPYASLFYGIKPLWASEILPQAVSVTKRHFPDMKHVGDITDLDGSKLHPVDIITFGSPCQDLSVAGKREGLSGARSGLFIEAIRIIDEMRRETDGAYPKYTLWENVPGVLSSSGGLDFKTVLEAFTKSKVPIPRSGKWANAGMVRSGGASLAWRILNACMWGVPQRRRRIFLIANFGSGCAGEILFIEKGLRRHFAAGGKTRQETPADVGKCASCPMSHGVKNMAATLCSGYGTKWNGNAGAYDGSNFALSPNPDCLNLLDTQKARAFTDSDTSAKTGGTGGGKGSLIRQDKSDALATGNGQCLFTPSAVGVHQSQDGSLGTSESAYSLATSGNASSRSAPLVACGFDLAQITSKQNRTGLKEIQPALCKGGDPHIVVASKTGIHEDANLPEASNAISKDNGVSKSDGPEPTAATGDHTITAVFNRQRSDMFGVQDIASTQSARQYKDATDLICEGKPFGYVPAVDCRNHKEACDISGTLQANDRPGYSLNYQNPVRTGYVVRRLTPTECERLQGFPDGWTKFGADGAEISDTRRYQMLGNSVATPCVEFIMSGIAAQIYYGDIRNEASTTYKET